MLDHLMNTSTMKVNNPLVMAVYPTIKQMLPTVTMQALYNTPDDVIYRNLELLRDEIEKMISIYWVDPEK